MSTTVDVPTLMARQDELARPIERAITNLKKTGEANLTKRRITGRLEALRTSWTAYQENHEAIERLRKSTTDKSVRKYIEEHAYYKEERLANVQEIFLDAQEDMENRLDRILADEPGNASVMAARSMQQTVSVPHNHRLPKINLPEFDGNPREWIAFRDLFHALVGTSTSITGVEKLHYLKTSLTGAAASRIQSISLMGENFVTAWEYLTSVYDNKRLLVTTAMRDFMDTKPVLKSSSTDLDRFNSEITRAITALEALGQYNNHAMRCDVFVIFIAVSKLDANTVREWEESQGCSQSLPTWQKLRKFFEARVRSLQAFELARQRSSQAAPPQQPKNNRAHNVATAQLKTTASSTESNSATTSLSPLSTPGCSACGASHYIASCQAFRNKSQAQRNSLVKEKQLCFNCFGPHKVAACRSQKRCQTCSGQHHTLLHTESASTSSAHNATPRTSQPTTATGSGGAAAVSHAISRSLTRKRILLTTALVRVQSLHGEEVHARALLDTGSELSFISKSLAQLLKLSRRRCNIPLVGIGAQRSGSTNGAVPYTVRPHFSSDFSCRVNALTLDRITADLPSLDSQERAWPHLEGLQLADPDYATTGQIDVLLGADVYGQLLDTGLRQGSTNTPVAHRTKLGWVLSGPTSAATRITALTHGLQCSIDRDTSECDLQSAIQRFWLQEEVKSTSSVSLSAAEEACAAHFLATHSRDNSGRFIVRLPFKSSPEVLGDSRERAQHVLSRMQKRLSADLRLQTLYCDFLQQYEALGHMQLARTKEIAPTQGYYLRHHGVLKKSSTTTKLRVVFNGSARTRSDYSLNDVLHIGAKLQTDLPDVILRWQKHQFAFAADIEKMFRQINVHPDDWDFQRILWSPDTTQPSKEYQLTTVTYGLGPAPFLANRVLRELASKEENHYPLAADIIRQSTYVDDTFGGADSLEAAQETVQQLDNLCMAGGFTLQKWSANYSVVLSNVPQERLATTNSHTLEEDPPMKTLRIAWKPSSDSFVFSGFKIEQEASFTKRKVLSQVSQLFDPLGWLSPVIIRAKILMQDLWVAQVGWDEPLTELLAKRWQEFLEQLQTVTRITIPRWLGTSSSALAVEIHGFSDASVHTSRCSVPKRRLRPSRA